MANNTSRSPQIIIKQLILEGIRKNYIVSFHTGLNIIHGDIDTGKSTILNLIDYCLGAGSIDLYSEISAAGKYCLLEVALNTKVYVIKRNIFDTKEDIKVYHSDYLGIDTVFPVNYTPSFNNKDEDIYFSDFLMDALSIPKVKIKQAPSKSDSAMQRLSFRDIFKFNYVNQDDVGSKDLLDRKNPVVAVKNQETFKFLHNLLDEAITELQSYISSRTQEKKTLDSRYNIIASFLRETQLKSKEELDTQKKDLKDKIATIDEELALINQNMSSSTSVHNELQLAIDQLKKRISSDKKEMESLQLQMHQNILLKNDYGQDIQKLETSLKVSEQFPEKVAHTNCPVCDNTLKVQEIESAFKESGVQFIEREIKSLRRRYKDISILIGDNRNNILLLQQQITKSSAELDDARVLLDNRTKDTISPFLSQRDGYISTRSKILEAIENLDHTLKIRNQLNEIANKVAKLEVEIEKLTISLNELNANTPTTVDVTNAIGDLLNDFLTTVKMNNVTEVSIHPRTFMPIIRGIDYFRLTSGGVRTLVTVGYFVSILKNSMDKATNHPNFLMIDTLGKYLGKTKSQYLQDTSQAEDFKEGLGVNDPTKYINMYKYLLSVCADREDVQIIVVDNDVPPIIESDLKEYVVRQFSVEGHNGLPRGFIDDAFLN